MGSKQPLPDRCGARLRGAREGEFCTKYPVKGATRCRNHGGTVQKKKMGLYTVSGMTLEGRQRLQEYMDDGALLDARRPVAIHAVLMESGLVMPSEEEVDALAELVAAKRTPPKTQVVVTELDKALARVELAWKGSRIIRDHAALQESALKAVELRDLMREELLPILALFSEEVSKLVRKYVPPDSREEFVQALLAARAQAVANAHRTLEQVADK